MRIIHVTVELSRTRKRVWLKAVSEDGNVQIIENIPYGGAIAARNALVEKLAETYDTVTSAPIPKRGQAPLRVGPFVDPGPEKGKR